MQINGLSHAQAAQSLSGASRSSAAGRSSETAQVQSTLPADELELSPEAEALSQTQATGQSASADGIRWDRVNALRQAIAEGNYDSAERVSGTIDKFLDAYA